MCLTQNWLYRKTAFQNKYYAFKLILSMTSTFYVNSTQVYAFCLFVTVYYLTL
jgi:hypothetical protein